MGQPFGVQPQPSATGPANQIQPLEPDPLRQALTEQLAESAQRSGMDSDEYRQLSAAHAELSQADADSADILTRIKNFGEMKASRGPETSVGSVLSGIGTSFGEAWEKARQGTRLQFADVIGSEGMYSDAARKYEQSVGREARATPEIESTAGRWVYGGAQNVVRMIPAITTSLLTKNPATGLSVIGAEMYPEAYAKYRTRGGGKGEAALGAATETGIEVATELLPMSFLVNKMGKVGMGEFLRGFLGRELPTELAAEISQAAVDTAIANPTKTWEQFAAELPETIGQTVTGVAMMGGGLAGVNAITGRMAERGAGSATPEPPARAEPSATPTEPVAAATPESIHAADVTRPDSEPTQGGKREAYQFAKSQSIKQNDDRSAAGLVPLTDEQQNNNAAKNVLNWQKTANDAGETRYLKANPDGGYSLEATPLTADGAARGWRLIAVFHPDVTATPAVETAPAAVTTPERPARQAPAAEAVGAPRRIWTAKGEAIDTRMEVVEADQLVTSHNEAGGVNPAFPEDLQPRDRSRQDWRRRVANGAENLNPETLGDTGNAYDGAPVVGPDNVVESGNTRTLAMRKAYQSGKAEEYKQWLKHNAGAFGLDPGQIDGMRSPVLVRRRAGQMTAEQRAAFAQEANVRPEQAETAVPSGTTQDRRHDLSKRQRVAEMSAEEMRRALLTDELTGIGNRRGYDEVRGNFSMEGLLDLDAFKGINDAIGYEGGDAVLQTVAGALADVSPNAFRVGGDEFYVLGNADAEIRTVMDSVAERLKEARAEYTAPNGKTYVLNGVGFSYGIGKTKEEANAALKTHKQERTETGDRPGRGEPPRQLAEKPAEGRPTQAEPTESPEKVAETDVLAEATAAADKAAAPSGLYSNPLGPMYDGLARATQRLGDALGLKSKDTTIGATGKELEPGLLTPFLSPSTVANNYPVLARYLRLGQRATEVQERLRNAFGRRMHAVEVALGRRQITNILNPRFRANKTALWNLMLEEDTNGQSFTADELRDRGANDQVIQAHRLMRAAYDHALGAANAARAARGKEPVNRRGGYVPHFFHNYFIVVDGQIIASARTLREAVSMSNDAARAGKKIRIVPKQFKFDGEHVQAAVLGDMDYFKMQGKLEKDFSMSQQDAQDMLEQLARRRGRSRFVGNFLERKGVKGWEKDLDWVHRHYFNMVARYAALDHFKSKAISRFERDFGGFDKDQRGIGRYIKNYINDVNGVPTVAEDLINNSIAKVPALGKFLGSYFGDRPAIQIASATTKGVAVAKLALYNISSALINATQTVNTNTLIGPRWVAVGAARWSRIEAAMASRKFGVDTRANRDLGLLRQMGVDVAMGLADGAGYSKAGLGKFFRASTIFFSGVERFNRVTAALGAYYKARHDGRSHAQALAYGKDVVERTQFDYSVSDTPSFIRQSGPVGQLLFQFKKFPIKEMEFMVSLRGAEHAKFWIPYLILGGYFALPGLSLLINMIRSLFDLDMELELKKFLMEWAGTDKTKQAVATQILRGVFGHAGVDVSKRVGAGDFIPDQLSDLTGPGISTAVRATQMAARGDWIETLRAITTAPGNLAKAIANDGEVTDPYNRDRSLIKLKPSEQLMASVGFTPERVSQESDTARLIRYETGKVNNARREIIDAVIEAAKLAESGETEKADARIRRIMARADRMQIGFTTKQLNTELEQKNLTRAQRAWIAASPEIKARMAGIMEYHESRQPETRK